MDQQHPGESMLDLEVDPQVTRSLREATRWAQFIGIVQIVFLGILLLAVLFGGKNFSEGVAMALEDRQSPFASFIANAVFVILGVFIVIWAVVLFFLFRFTSHIKSALQRQDQILFNSGLRSLKNYLTMQGVIAILYLLYILISSGMSLFNSNME